MNCNGYVIRANRDDGGLFLNWEWEEAVIEVPANEQGCVACCGRPVLDFENGEDLPTISCDGEGCTPRTRPKAGSTTGEIEIWCCRG